MKYTEKMKVEMDYDETYICVGCKQECQTNVCWCGTTLDNHYYEEHMYVPYSCTCFFLKDHSTLQKSNSLDIPFLEKPWDVE